MVKYQRAHTRLWVHHKSLCQLHTNLLRLQKFPNPGLVFERRTGGIAEAVASGCVFSEDAAYSGLMRPTKQFTAIIQQEGKYFVALCPELDVVSQGKTVEQARQNVAEAVELFLEEASPAEIRERLHKTTYVTQVEVAVG
jgi:predicted RNase H-like HicB family nuclease